MNPFKSRIWTLLVAALFSTGAVRAEQEENPIIKETNASIERLHKDTDKEAGVIAGRLSDFMLGYVDPKFKTAAEASVRDAVKKWVAGKVADPKTRKDFAQVGYILGLTPESHWRQTLAADMDTHFKNNQLQGALSESWMVPFCRKAVSYADQIYNTVSPQGPTPIKDSMLKEGGDPVDARGAKGGTVLRKSMYMGFNRADLYEDGAIVNDMIYQKGDKTRQRISLKINTRKDEDGTMINELGICNITIQGDTLCRKVEINSAGNGEKGQTFALDDRQPNMPEYTLIMTPDSVGNMSISFGRPDQKQPMKTTLSALYAKRVQQVKRHGRIVSIEGQNYFVLAEGGHYGSLLYYNKDMIDAGHDAAAMTPEMLAVVNHRDGSVDKNYAKPDLGTVGGKEYHVEFHKPDVTYPKGYWDVVEGKGEKTPPEEKPATAKESEAEGGDAAAVSGDGAEAADEDEGGKAATSGMARCDTGKVNVENTVKKSQDKWTYFFNTNKDRKNQFYICAYGGNLLFSNGLLTADGIRFEKKDKDYFVVDLIESGEYVDPKLLPPSGEVPDESIPGGEGRPEYSQRRTYYIPKAGLNEAKIKESLKYDSGTPLPRLASVMQHRDVQNNGTPMTLNVYLRDAVGKPDAAVKTIVDALNVFAPESALAQLYASEEGKAIIEGYITKEFSKYNGKKIAKDAEHAGDNLSPDLHFQLSLYGEDEMKGLKDYDELIKPSVLGEKSDTLIYCGMHDEGVVMETMSEHAKHTKK